MKNVIIAIVSILSAGFNASPQNVDGKNKAVASANRIIKKSVPSFEKLFGGNLNDYAQDIQQTTDGGFIIAGYTNSSASGDVKGANHGGNDFWIVKLDASGNIVWNKLLGGTGNDVANDIQQTKDGGYIVAGHTSSSANGDVTGTNHGYNLGSRGLRDCWIVKLDASGNTVWNKLLGGDGDDGANDIQQTTDGGYIVAGFSDFTMIGDLKGTNYRTGDVTGTNHGMSDSWIVKLDASGNIVWNKLLGGIYEDVPNDIQQTTDGGYIVAGYSGSSTSGDVKGTNHGSNDYWIIKLDGSGNIVWNKLFGGTATDVAQSIQQTTDGGYIVAGYISSSTNGDVIGTNHGMIDYWVLKLGASGNIVWNKLLGGEGEDIATDIRQTTDGGYIVAGYSTISPKYGTPGHMSGNGDVPDTNHGMSDYWVVKLDASGNIVWNRLLGGTAADIAQSIQQTIDGGFIVAGHTNSSASGDVASTNLGSNGYWILKLDASGLIIR